MLIHEVRRQCINLIERFHKKMKIEVHLRTMLFVARYPCEVSLDEVQDVSQAQLMIEIATTDFRNE